MVFCRNDIGASACGGKRRNCGTDREEPLTAQERLGFTEKTIKYCVHTQACSLKRGMLLLFLDHIL